MTDEPGMPEEKPKAPSIWETFDKNRVTEPKITEPEGTAKEVVETGIDEKAIIKGFYSDQYSTSQVN